MEGKLCTELNSFFSNVGQGQGHVIKIDSSIGKVLP